MPASTQVSAVLGLIATSIMGLALTAMFKRHARKRLGSGITNEKKNNDEDLRRLTTFCLTGALTLAASGGAGGGNDAALQALFAQANYWHEKSHDELAMESLQKVLSVDANNTQALYLMALWSQQGGDMQAAAQWRAAGERPLTARDYRIWTTPKDVAGAAGPAQPGPPAGARRQSPGRWRPAQHVHGNTPPAGLAAEYYLTMAATNRSIRRLSASCASTWRSIRRRTPAGGVGQSVNGGKRLAGKGSPCSSRWPAAKEADSGLRQALLWLGPQAGDEQYYDTGCSGIPDSEVQNYFRERRSGQARGQGYANLNSGNTAGAKQQFEEVLQTNPGCRCAGGHGLYRPAQRRLPAASRI